MLHRWSIGHFLLNMWPRVCPNWVRSADDALLFAEKACYEFKNGDEEKQRAILEMLDTNHTLKDRLLTVEIQKPLELLKDMSRSYLDSRALDFTGWISEEISKKMDYFRELRKAWI